MITIKYNFINILINFMPSRININQRIIYTVSIPVECLGIINIRQQFIRGSESAQYRIIKPCFVIVKFILLVVFLAGVFVMGSIYNGIKDL